MSGHRRVFLGFAPASLLHALSFADVLDEDTGRGYQRRFSAKHSWDFRRYVQQEGSTTIPLTFNLRPRDDGAWRLIEAADGARLEIAVGAGKVFAQVDCQHRIGHIGELEVMLPFMTFIGLNVLEEMEIFKTINSKARGLSSSLLDFHEAHLADDLGKERPELLVALSLNEDDTSPWYKQLDIGGNRTSGMTRRASLRTMQKAVKKFLSQTSVLQERGVEEAARIVIEYWMAVSNVLEEEWRTPRKHFVTKGIGVYALMGLLSDLYKDAITRRVGPSRRYFEGVLVDFVQDVDWSTNGPFKGLGGEAGAREALTILRKARASTRGLKMVSNG